MLEVSLEILDLLKSESIQRFVEFLKFSLFVQFQIIQSVTKNLVLFKKTLDFMIVLSLCSQELGL